jgi:hypothetical protein
MEIIRHSSMFCYPASVIPRRGRRPHRVNLFKEMEYDITSVSSSETQKGAVVVTVREPFMGPVGPISFTGWQGRLWLPLRMPYQSQPVTINEYFDLLDANRRVVNMVKIVRQSPRPPAPDDPIDQQHDRRMSPLPVSVKMKSHQRYMSGKVVWEDEAAALAGHKTACDRLLAVDGTMHYRTDGPVWAVPDESTYRRFTILRVCNHYTSGKLAAYTFRADRLADAQMFAALRRGAPEQSFGSIIALDPTYMTRDDLAHGLQKRLSTDLTYAAPVVLHLPPEVVVSWRRLVDAVDPLRPFQADGVSDPAAALADAEAVLNALKSRVTPSNLASQRERLVRTLNSAREFASFARSRGWPIEPPQRGLSQAERDALNTLHP